MKNEIKTRHDALNASKRKWADLLERIDKIQIDVESNCGFCVLARMKSKKVNEFRCKHCEPDAKELCEVYITDHQLITRPLGEAWSKTNELLDKIKALPDVRALKEK